MSGEQYASMHQELAQLAYKEARDLVDVYPEFAVAFQKIAAKQSAKARRLMGLEDDE